MTEIEGFEWDDNIRADVLIINLAKLTIQSVGDVFRLADESESIKEDYPEFNLIIFRP